MEITSANSFGGGERHLVDISRGFVKRGHDVFIAMRDNPELENRLGFLPEERIIKFALRNSLDLLSAHKISRFLVQEKIDIVHAHLARDYPPASMATRLSRNTKFFITRHVMFPMKNMHKLVLGNVENAIAVSAAVESRLKRIFPVEKVVCIPNGLAMDEFSANERTKLSAEFKNEYNIPKNVKVVSIVGELSEIKRQEDFVIAAGEIAKELEDVHFVVVGIDNTFDQSERRKLRRLANALNLENKFTFLDWIENLKPIFSATDVLVSASLSESFGLAILEGMANGAAVVATKTDGATELTNNGEFGKLVPLRDPLAIANNVLTLLQSDELRFLIAESAAKRAFTTYGLDKMISATEALFLKSLSS
ncbi:MAG: glycosyltransferase family 4 protein [Pyrinomonadaceae bacterium]